MILDPAKTPDGVISVRPDGERETVQRPHGDESLAPSDAMYADLLAVREALDRAHVDVLLIRGGRDRAPVLVVDVARRADVERAFATAFAGQSFLARAVRRDRSDGRRERAECLLEGGALPGDVHDNVFLLFRRRARGSRPGWRVRDAAVQLELWEFTGSELVAPRVNALTRRVVARGDVAFTVVERYGMSWSTLQGMFDESADDVDFPIDMVFSWVDGSSAEHLGERSRYSEGMESHASERSPARYRHIDELRYALRSVHAFAPWVRRIFIVTDSVAPSWLNTDHPDVTVVRSAEFFLDPTVLPTFNSHAVESQLHRVSGLAEHFLYSNDDMFFGRPVAPGLFFSPGGITKFVEARLRIGVGGSHPGRSAHDNAMRVNRALLYSHFGRTITRHLEHCPVPMRVSVLSQMENEFAADFRRTAASRLRAATDISVTNSLAPYFGLFSGSAVQQTDARVSYVETTLSSAPRALQMLEEGPRVDMFCLNDGSEPEIDEAQRVKLVTSFLERYFPLPAPWELAAPQHASSLRNTLDAGG